MTTSGMSERDRYRMQELPGRPPAAQDGAAGWLAATDLLILGVECWFLAVPLLIAMVAAVCVGWPMALLAQRLPAGPSRMRSMVDCTRRPELPR